MAKVTRVSAKKVGKRWKVNVKGGKRRGSGTGATFGTALKEARKGIAGKKKTKKRKTKKRKTKKRATKKRKKAGKKKKWVFTAARRRALAKAQRSRRRK